MSKQATRKQLQDDITHLQSVLDDTRAQLKAVDESYKGLHENYRQLMKSSNAGLAQGADIEKMQKQLTTISLITQGKHDEAVQQILTPIPMIFSLDIRFADDASAEKARDEQLESLKKLVITAVSNTKIVRKESSE